MNFEAIDSAIDNYVNERMIRGKKKACERFLACAHLKHRGEDLVDFLKRAGGLSRYYMDYLRVMQNPLKGPELAWLASMITVAVYAVFLMTWDEARLLGILIFSGTVVHAWALIARTAKKWCDLGVMIAIYREVAQLAEAELEQELGSPPFFEQ